MSTVFSAATDSKGALFVNDVVTATCVFCPYGADVEPGDRIRIYDERPGVVGESNERMAEVTAVKIFRSTGRRVTLDLVMISDAEARKIATDSDTSVATLLEHRAGTRRFDRRHPPVVVYFASVH